MGPNNKQLHKYNTIITVSFRKKISHTHPLSHKHFMADYIHVDDINSSTQLCMLLSKPLVHNVLNLDTVELDLISSLKLFHVLIPTFRNDFNGLVVRTGGLCKRDLCLVLYECTDELLINILLNICGTLPVWK